MTSHLLPAYARADLAFERGEGAWLIATDGERYLDFTSGVAVNALGHAHPHLVAAVQAQVAKLCARLQSLPHSRGRAAGRAAVRGQLRRHGVLRQFRRRGAGSDHQDGAQVPIRERPSRALPHHHLRRRVPRPHAGDARRRRTEEASRRLRSGGGRLRPGAGRRHRSGQARHRPGHRRHPDRADHGRGRRAHGRAAVPQGAARTVRPARPAAGVRRGADRHRPHRRTVRLSAHRRDARRHGARQGARRRISDRRLPCHRRGREGHDGRHPRLDLRRQSAGDGGGQRRARRRAGAGLPRSRRRRSRCCSSSGWPNSRTGTLRSSRRCAAKACWSG